MTHGYKPGGADPAMNRIRSDRRREHEKREANRPTGTEIGQITRKLQELTQQLKAAQDRIAQLVAFLTGQQGYAANESSWSDDSDPSGNIATVAFVAYDAKVDCSTTFVAQSSVVDIRIAAWLDSKVNAYAADGKTAYGVNATAALAFDLIDADTNAVVYQPQADDAAEVHTEVWGTNIANVVGVTGSNIARVTGLTAGRKYTLRSRRGRSGYAHGGDGNPITMPSGGWWNVVVNNPRLNVTMVAATDTPPDSTTPTDPDTTTDGGNS